MGSERFSSASAGYGKVLCKALFCNCTTKPNSKSFVLRGTVPAGDGDASDGMEIIDYRGLDVTSFEQIEAMLKLMLSSVQVRRVTAPGDGHCLYHVSHLASGTDVVTAIQNAFCMPVYPTKNVRSTHLSTAQSSNCMLPL